jgi:hypothetical protein
MIERLFDGTIVVVNLHALAHSTDRGDQNE